MAKRILVLGGRGFIGRAVAEALSCKGHAVTITSRNAHGRANVTCIPLRLEQTFDAHALVNDYDVVVNCVGILRPRYKETYRAIHYHAVEKLVRACEEENKRFIHVSALGLKRSARSRFILSKLDGEAAIKTSNAPWFIVRAPLLDGKEGYGARWLRRVASWPVHLLPSNAKGRLAPLHVTELALAIAELIESPDRETQRVVELGGLENLTLEAYLERLKGREPFARIRVPAWTVRLASHVLDLLHATPLSFGHYELLKDHNRPKQNDFMDLVGRFPKPIKPNTKFKDKGAVIQTS